ncbi:gluconolactonase [Brevibacterium sp. 5221]|uniref:Gluconolactonase n=1 Tax=Brevibacterium rongguiense TaxID=2695267 RepID=A0A6N9H417_9MICO|nr:MULTISPECIES: SMP-30/gluconolactonase/LRE family protein [Brevibacterium]MYM18571.1 gluconolactonase [Brevibacterium rongguiense]WAL39645.1 SMP-30/gluconolactonase/LRE family protein [Brevibacterium sp. BRM-1]
MSERDVQTIATGFTFTECPRWHDERWWFVDFYTHRILSMRADGSDLRTEVEVPQRPSGLGWLPDGTLLFVSMRDRRVMRKDSDGSVSVHADLSRLAAGYLNDMIVDAQGRAYVGNFGFDLTSGADIDLAALIRVDTDGTATAVAHDLWFPNGMAITDDGSTLLVNETFGGRVSAFDIGAGGALGERRDWAKFSELPQTRSFEAARSQLVVEPDGCGLDAQGRLWVADAMGGRALLVAEGGDVEDEIPAGTGVFACMLGGPDGHDLFLSCAPDYDEHKRSAAREATVKIVRAEVPHGGRP